MNIAIRVDASIAMGIGHIMRCLTLANEMKKQAVSVTFICRDPSARLIELIGLNDHQLVTLEKSFSPLVKSSDSKANWLSVTEKQDASDTIKVLEGAEWNWLIVDHYELTAEWETRVSNFCNKIMVIDDLANRNHSCDLLLDQTYGREPTAYEGLVSESCEMLLGTHFALLRPEFSELRGHSLLRREQPALNRVVISMGGTDPKNATSKTLDVLAENELLDDLRVEAIVSSDNPWVDDLRDKILQYDADVNLLVDVEDIAQILAQCDLVIGAAGTSVWERCCLGVPALMTVLAQNQALIAETVSDTGASINLGEVDAVKFEQALVKYLTAAKSTAFLRRMSDRATEIVDGRGASRVSRKLSSYETGI